MAFDLAGLTAARGFTVTGLNQNDFLGVSPTYLGDVNGDGIDDFGFVAERAGGAMRGLAFVVFGREGGFGESIDYLNLGDGGFTLRGYFDFAQLNRIGAAGDLNNDGYDDVVVSISRDDTYGVFTGTGTIYKHEGAVFVAYGGPDLGGTLRNVPVADGFMFESTERSNINTPYDTGEELGYSAGDVGDFNGDGIDDLIFGSNGDQDTPGDGFIVFGREDGNFPSVMTPDDLDGTNGARFRGLAGGDATGTATTFTDLNNDGIADLVIGARDADGLGRQSSGKVFVIFGGQTLPDGDIQLSDAGGAQGLDGFTLIGPGGTLTGWAVDAAGDVNGDGIEDLIIGNTGSNGFYQPGDPNFVAPEAYVIYGREGGYPGQIDLAAPLSAALGFKIVNIGTISFPHSFVSGVGDVNADGYDDLLVGADDTNGFAGQVTLIYGGPALGGVVNAATIDGTTKGVRFINSATQGQLGNGVKGAGDINHDGVDDFLIGSNGANINGFDSGQLFGLYGTRIEVPDSITLVTESFGPSATLDLTISLTAPALTPIDVRINTESGTAVAGSDFTTASGFLRFAAGEQTRTFSVTVFAHEAGEQAEQFSLSLQAEGAGFGDSLNHTITVTIPQFYLLDNQAPDARDDAIVTREDTPSFGSVFGENGNGIDSDPDGDDITVTAVNGAANDVGGTVVTDLGIFVITANGNYQFTPFADTVGTTSISYTIADDIGKTDTATLTVRITGENDSPFTSPLALDAFEDVTLTGNLQAMAGDGIGDPDGDTLSFTVLAGSANGTLTLAKDGSFDYTPSPDYAGTDSFIYTVSDGLESTSGTVTLTVTATNDAPVAGGDGFTLIRGTVLSGSVLTNDTDIDGDTLTANLLGTTQNGMVQLSTDGSFTYTPLSGFTGTDSFTYEVEDGQGGSDVGTVSITVTPPPTVYALDMTQIVVEEGAPGTPQAFSFTVTRSGDADAAGSVAYAISGSGAAPASADDFASGTALSGLVMFAPGETAKTVTGTTAGDFIPEADESFVVSLSNPFIDGTGSTAVSPDAGSLTATIANDDIPTETGTAGNDKLKGTRGDDFQLGGAGDDKLKAGTGNDILFGEAGNDRLDGSKGNDVLFGGDDDDRLKDNKGDNIFDGGAGNDTIRGGKGNDTFIFKKGNETDLIQKFGQGSDVIDLTGVVLSDGRMLDADGFFANAEQVGKDVILTILNDTFQEDVLILAKTDLEDISLDQLIFA